MAAESSVKILTPPVGEGIGIILVIFWTPGVSELPTQDQNWVKIWFWIFRVREIGKTYQEPINS